MAGNSVSRARSTDVPTPGPQATTMIERKGASRWFSKFRVLRGKSYLSTTDLAVLVLVATLSLIALTTRILATPGLNLSAVSFLSPLISLGHFLDVVVTLEWVPTLDRHAVIYVMLLPTAALLITFARLTFGLRVLGFRSVLIAVGFQEVGVGPSLLLIAVVLGVIATLRPWMRRVRLPLYARVSLILAMTAGLQILFLMVGSWQRSHTMFNLAFFPVIILAMMAEGIAGTLDQNRPATAAWRLGWTLALALLLFGIMNFGPFLKLLLRAPELMVLQIVAIVLVSEFLDFRLLQDWQNHATALISRFASDSVQLPIQHRKKRVAVVRNKTSHGTIGRLGPQANEAERNTSLQHLIDALREQGYSVKLFEGDMTLLRELRKFLPPHPRTGAPGGVVLNMSTGIQGIGRQVHVPSLLEMGGVAYTGADPLTQSFLCDRIAVLSRLQSYGLPVPDFRLITRWHSEPPDLPFPMVLRARDDSDDTRFIVRTPDEYSGALSHLSAMQSQGILCEAWLEGTLISVGVLGNDRLRCLPIASFNPSSRHVESPAPVDEPQAQHYRSIAMRAFRSIGCRDFARVDMVLDRQGQAHVVGISTNTILEKRGTFATMAHAAGLSWPALMGTIVELAGARCGVDWGTSAQAIVAAVPTAKPVVTGA